MQNQKTCATKGLHDYLMCEFCSSMKFDEANNPYWMCEKYNQVLKENDNHFLVRCKQCNKKD